MTMITDTSHCRPRTKATAKPGILARLLFWNRIWVERQALKDLEPHLLKDIGLTEDEARRESRRPSWDAPDRWLR